MTEILSGTITLSAIVLALTFVVMGAKVALQPRRPVTIVVNETTRILATAGQTLMTALGDAGYRLPGTCGGRGTCGLCRTAVMAGGGLVLPAEQARLSRKELRDHVRLACQVILREDAVIDLPGSMLDAITVTGRVANVRQLTALIREIVIDLPPDCCLEPDAGAFVEVEIPPYELLFANIAIDEQFQPAWQRAGLRSLKASNAKAIVRAYSIANRPRDKGKVVLNIRLAIPPPNRNVPPGIASSYLFGLKADDFIMVRGPFGNFKVQDTKREMVFIGGGVGMAPLRAMIFDQLERKNTNRVISYWYGARSRADVFYAEEFEQLAHRHRNFRWTLALSEPAADSSWDGPTGFIHSVVRQTYLDNHPAPEECEYYLCGPPMMIRSVRLMLQELGIEADSIFFDDFGS